MIKQNRIFSIFFNQMRKTLIWGVSAASVSPTWKWFQGHKQFTGRGSLSSALHFGPLRPLPLPLLPPRAPRRGDEVCLSVSALISTATDPGGSAPSHAPLWHRAYKILPRPSPPGPKTPALQPKTGQIWPSKHFNASSFFFFLILWWLASCWRVFPSNGEAWIRLVVFVLQKPIKDWIKKGLFCSFFSVVFWWIQAQYLSHL